MKLLVSLCTLLLSHCAVTAGFTRSLSEFLSPEAQRGLHTDVLAAPLLNNSSVKLERDDVKWLYPAKLSDQDILIPLRQTAPLTSRDSDWKDWFRKLGAAVPSDVPSWVQLGLGRGRIFGDLRSIGDNAWIEYSSEDADLIKKSGVDIGPAPSWDKLYGTVRLKFASLAFGLHSIAGGQIYQRTYDLPAWSSSELEEAEKSWLKRIEPLRRSNFWQSCKDHVRLHRLFEPDSSLHPSQVTEIRRALASEYADWITDFSKTIGSNGVASVSPVEALRLVECAPKVPWSFVPQMEQVQGTTFLRSRRKVWRPELNFVRAMRIQKSPGLLSHGVRGEIAKMIEESDNVDAFTEPVLALEGVSLGNVSQRWSPSAVRVLALYKSQIGKHSAQPLLFESGLLNTFMLYATRTRDATGKLVVGPAVCALHSPGNLQLVEVARTLDFELAFIGGNDRFPFTYRSSPQSARALGGTLAEIMWTQHRVDSFDQMDELEVSAAEGSYTTINLRFPTGIATALLLDAPLKLETVTIGSLPASVRDEIKSAFDREIVRQKRKPAHNP